MSIYAKVGHIITKGGVRLRVLERGPGRSPLMSTGRGVHRRTMLPCCCRKLIVTTRRPYLRHRCGDSQGRDGCGKTYTTHPGRGWCRVEEVPDGE